MVNDSSRVAAGAGDRPPAPSDAAIARLRTAIATDENMLLETRRAAGAVIHLLERAVRPPPRAALTVEMAQQLADNIPIGMPQGERDLIASYLVRESARLGAASPAAAPSQNVVYGEVSPEAYEQLIEDFRQLSRRLERATQGQVSIDPNRLRAISNYLDEKGLTQHPAIQRDAAWLLEIADALDGPCEETKALVRGAAAPREEKP